MTPNVCACAHPFPLGREEDFRKREGWDKSSHMTHWFRFLVG